MQTIYKYKCPVDDEVTIQMPSGAKVLCVQVQHGEPCIWALVDRDVSEYFPRRFAWRGTGHQAEGLNNRMYVGTIQLHGGALVFHLFDRGA